MPQALLLLLLLCLPVFAQAGKVVGVTDGDTITVLSNRKQITVRLAGIDAPEKGQDYSDAAKKFLSFLIFGEIVTLEGKKVDRYGRLVAKVLFQGNDINATMVASGNAWHYKAYENEQTEADRKLYATAEKAARKNKLNLWTYPNPVPPWDFREGKNTASQTTNRPLVSRPIYQSTTGQIIGNRNSMIYHFPSCPSYDKVSPKNRVYFKTAQEAERAGYRVAKNC